MTKIISWNLLRLRGASLDDVARLVRRERPELLLMQETTPEMDKLAARVGGYYVRSPLPGRIHGLAVWSAVAFTAPPVVLPLPSGAVFDHARQVLDLGDVAIANVHLSHGQVLNRRQLRHVAEMLPHRAAVLGDCNLVGPAFLPGFRDVGPREHTHRAGEVVPLRIDRCLVRGVGCVEARSLPRQTSDHRAILVRLDAAAEHHRPARLPQRLREAWPARRRRSVSASANTPQSAINR